jgi:hypothetical protein
MGSGSILHIVPRAANDVEHNTTKGVAHVAAAEPVSNAVQLTMKGVNSLKFRSEYKAGHWLIALFTCE